MKILRPTRLAALATVLCLSTAVHAADLIINPEPIANQDVDLVAPAVSGVNGKFEIDVGAITDPNNSTFRLGGSLSVPVGDAFGLQGDVALSSLDGDITWGGALHAFTRDPKSYLVGLTAGYVTNDNASLAAIGPEAELYLGNISLEAWAGWAKLDYDSPVLDDESGAFFIGDIAAYVTDDWRISAGVSSILGENSFNVGTEYLLTDMGLPLSLTGEVRAYDDDRWSAKIGLKGYFGGEDKSLIRRHREDDPKNRVFDMFGAASKMSKQASPGDYDDESSCEDAGFYWAYDNEEWICTSKRET